MKTVANLLACITASSALGLRARAGCSKDNCLRALDDIVLPSSVSAASSFCRSYLTAAIPTTASPSFPTYLAPCSSQVLRVSSACECFISTTLATSSTGTSKTSGTTSSTTLTTHSSIGCPSLATVTLPASTVTVHASTITLPASTVTLPASTKTVPAVTSTKTDDITLPASTITLPASTKTVPAVTSTITDDITLPASTITLPPSTITLPPSTITIRPAASTITDDVTLPAATITLSASTITIIPAASTVTDDITLPASTSTVTFTPAALTITEDITLPASTFTPAASTVTDDITLPASTFTPAASTITEDITLPASTITAAASTVTEDFTLTAAASTITQDITLPASTVTITVTTESIATVTLVAAEACPTPALLNGGFETGQLQPWVLQGNPVFNAVQCQPDCSDCSYPPDDDETGCGFGWTIYQTGSVRISQTVEMCLSGTYQLSFVYWIQNPGQLQAFVDGVSINGPDGRTDACGVMDRDSCEGQWVNEVGSINFGPATPLQQLSNVTISLLATTTDPGTYPGGCYR